MASYQVERRKRGILGWIFLVLFWAFNAWMLLTLAAGLSNVAENYGNTSSSAERAGAAIGTTLGVGLLMAVWATGAIVLGLCALLTRGPKIIETVSDEAAGHPAPGERAQPSATVGSASQQAARPAHNVPWWAWAVGTVLLIGILSYLNPPAVPTTAPPVEAGKETRSVPVEATPQTPATPSNWSYRSTYDRMREATDRFATTNSTNVENFGFPYENVQMSIMLRHSAQYGRDIIILLNEGQFLCRYDGCTIRARFDDGEIQSFSVDEAEGGTNEALFIRNQSRFLTALRTAHSVTIEASFFNHGAEQFTFNVSGLEWE